MTLRKKILGIISMTIISLILILYVISHIIILESFVSLEEQYTHQHVERVLSALSGELAELNNMAGDWAPWDDTYAFVEGPYDDYVKKNLIDSTFINLRLNLMLFVHSSGQIVFSKAFDLSNEQEVPVPESLQEHLADNSLLLHHLNQESNSTGIILLPENPMLVASRPILTSEGKGPIRGTLIMGRYLDSIEVERLAEITHLSLTLYRFNSLQLPLDFQKARLSLSEEVPIFIQHLSETSIAGYGLINDIYGKPGLILRIDMPREIYKRGRVSTLYFVSLLLIISLVLGMMILVLVEKIVLSRLAQLNTSVKSIRTNSDLSTRVPVAGKDELASLGSAINGMLETLEQSQSKLRESEERFRKVFEEGQFGIAISNPEFKFEKVNPAFCHMLGYPPEELAARTFVDITHPDHIGQDVENIAKLGRGEIAFYKTEKRYIRRTGEIIWGSLIVSAIRNEEGTLLYHLVMIEDITERKRAEEEVWRLNVELEARVQQRTTQLEAMNKELQSFAYVVSHDLKAPLRGISHLADWLAQDYTNMFDEQGKEMLSLLNNRVKRMDNLIDGILEYSRIGRVMSKDEPLDLDTLLRDVLDTLSPPPIHVEIAHEFPVIVGDKIRITQVFQNLIGNAIKFMDKPQGEVKIGCADAGAHWQFSVTDNGPGIELRFHEKIFQIFQTLKPRDEQESTGIGLSIVKRIVEFYGGTIWVESDVGKGSTFFFTFPKKGAQP
jgi:PAS domain S-box-containing protein